MATLIAVHTNTAAFNGSDDIVTLPEKPWIPRTPQLYLFPHYHFSDIPYRNIKTDTMQGYVIKIHLDITAVACRYLDFASLLFPWG